MSCIVILDDVGTSRRVMSQLASSIEDNAAVVEFGDPFDALSFVRQNTPDLVITDYSMPVINGAEFIRRLRGVPKCNDVPVVVVTAYTNPEFRRLALEAGTTEYLSLPLNYEEFRSKSRSLLALRNARRIAEGQLSAPSDEEANAGELKQHQARAELLDGLLQTLSHRLIEKIKELDLAYGDLAALLDVSPCAAVFVDADFRMLRFTAAAASLLSLNVEDIGRRFLGAAGHFQLADIFSEMTAAKEHNRTVEKFVEDPKTNRYYRIRVTPTKYMNDELWGAIIVFDRMQVGELGKA
jgi:CheY-like chemotaxis protein